MAYSTMDAANALLNLKKMYEYGTDEDKKQASNDAKQYYDMLDSQPQMKQFLQNADYNTAYKYLDKINKTQGKVKIRDFINEQAKDYGKTANDLLKYDEATGQVSLGSMNLGLPDAEYDGITYWDADKLKKAWNVFVENAGLTKNTGIDNAMYNSTMGKAENSIDTYSNELTGDRNNENGYYQKLLDDLISHDITESKEYSGAFDKVMKNYGFKAEDAKENQLASDAADNGGNIDSFAAANAKRQRDATLAQGMQIAHQMGLDTYNARLNAITNILNNFGVSNSNLRSDRAKETQLYSGLGQQVFDNEETAKNNDVSRKKIISDVLGYAPKDWVDGNSSMFLDDNGDVKPEYMSDEFDNNGGFEAIIQKARANNDKELEKQAMIARTKKIFGNMAKYGQYLDNDIMVNGPQVTEERREFDQSDATSRYLADGEYQNNVDVVNANLQGDTGGAAPTMTYAQAEKAITNGELSAGALAVYNSYNGTNYTSDNPPPIYKGDTPKKNPSVTDKEVEKWVKYFNDIIQKQYGKDYNAFVKDKNGNYKCDTIDPDLVIQTIYGSDDLTPEQMEELIYNKFNITEDRVKAALKDKHYK